MGQFPKELFNTFPRLGQTMEDKDPMLWARLSNPISGWQWYLIEMEVFDTGVLCYVYEVGWESGFNYLSFTDLDGHASAMGIDNELDMTFQPCRLSELTVLMRPIKMKFPLGRVVATPGVLLAFEANQKSPIEFLMRHAQGDYGDLDAHDIRLNEVAETIRERLLSLYTLPDGTQVYIITEADRSATVLLLPSEY